MLNENSDDKELLAAFAESNTKVKAFELIFDKYNRKLYWVARRIVINHDDADDIMQNAWLNIWKHLNSFKEESKLYTWMYKITTNEALQLLQKKKKQLQLGEEEYQQILSTQLSDGVEFNGNKIQLALQEAILKLPEKQRIVFNLKYFENMTYEDMKEVLNTSVGALKASYHHAVKKIEFFLKDSLNY